MDEYFELEQSHSDLVGRLAKPGVKVWSEMTPKQAHLLHMAVGISGEAGELLDAIKKHVVYQKELDFKNVVEELGDMEFYMRGLRDALNIDRIDTIDLNIRKLTTRYGESYSNDAANERADKNGAE